MSLTPTSKVLLDFDKMNPSFTRSNIVVRKEDAYHIQNQGKNSKKCQFDSGEERLLTNVVPRSEVLGKVKDFVGLMAEADQQLERAVQDLFLGVADLQTPEAVAAAEAAIGGSGQSIPSGGISPSDTEDSCSDDDGDADMSSRGLKIVVLK